MTVRAPLYISEEGRVLNRFMAVWMTPLKAREQLVSHAESAIAARSDSIQRAANMELVSDLVTAIAEAEAFNPHAPPPAAPCLQRSAA